jgi:hypothetical protein
MDTTEVATPVADGAPRRVVEGFVRSFVVVVGVGPAVVAGRVGVGAGADFVGSGRVVGTGCVVGAGGVDGGGSEAEAMLAAEVPGSAKLMVGVGVISRSGSGNDGPGVVGATVSTVVGGGLVVVEGVLVTLAICLAMSWTLCTEGSATRLATIATDAQPIAAAKPVPSNHVTAKKRRLRTQ